MNIITKALIATTSAAGVLTLATLAFGGNTRGYVQSIHVTDTSETAATAYVYLKDANGAQFNVCGSTAATAYAYFDMTRAASPEMYRTLLAAHLAGKSVFVETALHPTTKQCRLTTAQVY